MIQRQHTADDIHAHLAAGLANDVADPLTRRALQDIVPILCDLHDVEPVVKSRVQR